MDAYKIVVHSHIYIVTKKKKEKKPFEIISIGRVSIIYFFQIVIIRRMRFPFG